MSIESAQDDSNARLLLRTEPCCPLHYEPVLPGGLEPPLPASGAGVLSPGPWERAWRTQVSTLVCRSDGFTDRSHTISGHPGGEDDGTRTRNGLDHNQAPQPFGSSSVDQAGLEPARPGVWNRSSAAELLIVVRPGGLEPPSLAS